MSPLADFSSSYLQSILSSALQGATSAGNSLRSNSTSSVTAQSENSRLSPFAQLMSTLQQLQQSHPTEYQQVTRQIAANLQNAAKTAQADGNSTQATHLNQLATDFTSASQSGQLPNMQALAQAISASTDAASSSSSSSSSSNGTSHPLSQLLAAFQANRTTNESLDPMAIITKTLSGAGISSTAERRYDS